MTSLCRWRTRCDKRNTTNSTTSLQVCTTSQRRLASIVRSENEIFILNPGRNSKRDRIRNTATSVRLGLSLLTVWASDEMNQRVVNRALNTLLTSVRLAYGRKWLVRANLQRLTVGDIDIKFDVDIAAVMMLLRSEAPWNVGCNHVAIFDLMKCIFATMPTTRTSFGESLLNGSLMTATVDVV